MNKTRQRRITRRQFMGEALAGAGAFAVAPAIVSGRNLSNKLNIAMIGAGGRGAANLAGVKSENIVALCDVDARALDKTGAQYPRAKRYADFRKLFDRPKHFDAVVVSTCEHTHAFATMLALGHGKHVYCEKPLTYNISEARLIRETASKLKLATQMGNQGHASDNTAASRS
jgi:predicted dehydrogenase